jgi:SAM-dependent methyltransferase
MPVSIGVQWPTEAEARNCGKGDLRLAFCRQCGFIWNTRFDLSRLEYSGRYENSLEYSPVFEKYAQELAQRLIDTYGIRNKQVIELGCGKGHFLTLICELGNNSGIGFDPSYAGPRVKSPASDRITYHQEFYGEKFTHYRGDLICCRHVFEHVPEPVSFLSMVRRTIGERTSAVVYFEVPDVRFILERLSIWDITYEHCSYFGRESLAGVFRRCGFRVLDSRSAYGSQFLSVDAALAATTATPDATEDLAEFTALVERFSKRVQAICGEWKERLAGMKRTGKRVVIWGGGTKAVTFLNMLGGSEIVSHVVDINPHKHGLHMPGTGQKIVSPGFLQEIKPEEIILMNPIYRQEIHGQVRSLGIEPKLTDVIPGDC